MAEEEKKRQTRAKKVKDVVTSGKRKRAIVRVAISKGTGRILFNNRPVSLMTDSIARDVMLEPLSFANASDYDISINANGGGVMGQAQAARTAISKALVAITGDASLKSRMVAFDRSLLIDDPRRVEPKKFKGPKARARFTKSYR